MTNAEALARLYNRSKTQGMGFSAFTPTPMTIEQAQAMIDGGQSYFDYVKGRVMKISLGEIDRYIASGDGDFRLYDRDNGQGAAVRALTDPANKPAGTAIDALIELGETTANTPEFRARLR